MGRQCKVDEVNICIFMIYELEGSFILVIFEEFLFLELRGNVKVQSFQCSVGVEYLCFDVFSSISFVCNVF